MRSAQGHPQKAHACLRYMAAKRLLIYIPEPVKATMRISYIQNLALKWLVELPLLPQEGLKRLYGSPASPRAYWGHVAFPYTMLMAFDLAFKLCFPKGTNTGSRVTSDFSSSPLTTLRNHGVTEKSLLMVLLAGGAWRGSGRRSKPGHLVSLGFHPCRYV